MSFLNSIESRDIHLNADDMILSDIGHLNVRNVKWISMIWERKWVNMALVPRICYVGNDLKFFLWKFGIYGCVIIIAEL